MKKVSFLLNASTSFVLIILFCYSIASFSAGKSLKEQLKHAISECQQTNANDEESPSTSESFVLDYKNGYAHVVGDGGSPGGCGCSSTAAAFIDSKQLPVIIEYHTEPCSWRKEIRSSLPMNQLLPKNLNAEFGLQKIPIEKIDLFYVSIDLPRKGIEIKIQLHLMPIGIRKKCENSVCIGLGPVASGKSERELYYIDFVLEGSNVGKVFEKVAKGLPIPTNETLEANLNRHEKNLLELQSDLKYLYEIYKLQETVKYDSLVMKWDKSSSRFETVRRIERKPKSFSDFMRSKVLYGPLG